MDILDAGVVHPPSPAGFRVQGALKHRTKNRGADLRPVEVLAGLVEDQVHDGFIQSGDYHRFFRKQAAVHIGKSCQILVHVGVSLFFLCVQYLKQVDQGTAGIGNVALQVIVKHPAGAEDPGVLGVQAKHQPHTQGVQAF